MFEDTLTIEELGALAAFLSKDNTRIFIINTDKPENGKVNLGLDCLAMVSERTEDLRKHLKKKIGEEHLSIKEIPYAAKRLLFEKYKIDIFYPKSDSNLSEDADKLKTQLEQEIPSLAEVNNEAGAVEKVKVTVKGMPERWFVDNKADDNQIRYEDPSEKAVAEALKSLIVQNGGRQFRLHPLYTYVSKDYLSIFLVKEK